ncbi:MAG: type IV pilus secretin PilQ [Burkholderiales bacterium]|nr:type IV pilus secretin PilQ [Burkholderiales bacterium]
MKTTLEKPTMHHWRASLAAIAVGIGLPIAAFAQNVIQSITSSQQAGTDVVRIELAEPLPALPAGFVVQAPPRVAIDLPNVGNALGRNAVELNQGNVRSVNVAQSGERTRLVLNLRQAASYRVQQQGKALIVLLEPATAVAAAGAGAAAPTQFAPSQNDQPLAVRGLDFRRGSDGAGRLIVDLPSTQVGVDIRQQGQSLVVELLRSTLPEGLRRRLDVTDFGTPVQTISALQSGDRVRLLVEPKGNWEHSAYQTDTQFVLEVRPVKVDPNKLTQGPGFQGEKLSLNFQNIEVRALLQVIADFTNFNVVTSDTVTGNVTLRLKDVPWDQALDIILQAKGLGVRKNGNVLWIAPKEELANREQVELEAKKKISELEPVRTQAFQLNYTKAETIAKSLVGSALVAQAIDNATGQNSGRILSPRGSVIFEQRTNQLFVTDIPSKLEEIQAMIAKIDIPVRQVLIEARIVEADDSFGRSLGVKLGFANLAGPPTSGPGAQVGGNYQAIGAQTGQSPPVDFANTQFVNLPANTGALGAAAATFALSLFSASANQFLNLELSALEADNKGKIVSSPRVITADQVKALIEQGEELPYQQATSSGATSVAFRKASLKLEVTPQITPEGQVILDLDVNKDRRGTLTLQGYTIDTKHVRTQVLVENGGTVVIGGIFQQEDLTQVNKVPWLGDIPYLGNLFKNTLRSTKKTELLVFITPKIVTDRSAVR